MAKQRTTNPTQRKKAVSARRSATLGDWIEGARLRTLPLAIVPVVLGTAAAISAEPGSYHWVRALAALVVALFLQIGVNFANDYSDGIRGTDDVRVGPVRLTASGLVPAKRVRLAAFICFGIAGLAGLFLCARTDQWWLVAVGVACILAAWFYTGGRRPYGYAGLGEVFVFVFFGLVATVGTAYVQVLTVPENAWPLAVASGLFACAVLMVNNLRDIDQDLQAGKHTLAARIGARASRVVFGVFALLPFAVTVWFQLVYPNVFFAYFAGLLVAPAVVIASMARTPRELILALKLVSIGALAWSIGMGVGLVLPRFI